MKIFSSKSFSPPIEVVEHRYTELRVEGVAVGEDDDEEEDGDKYPPVHHKDILDDKVLQVGHSSTAGVEKAPVSYKGHSPNKDCKIDGDLHSSRDQRAESEESLCKGQRHLDYQSSHHALQVQVIPRDNPVVRIHHTAENVDVLDDILLADILNDENLRVGGPSLEAVRVVCYEQSVLPDAAATVVSLVESDSE